MRKKVIVAGHICLDVTPVFPAQSSTDFSDILTPGKLLRMDGADIHTGGAVANTGLAMKLLGADVSLMGKIGNDAFGDIVYAALQKYDAEGGMIRTSSASTAYSIVLAVPGIDRIFLHAPGANDTFCATDIPQEALESAALFHFGYPPLMRSMYVDGGEELLAVLKKAREAGAATSLDMAAVDPESDAGKADWENILRKGLPYVDFFVPSAEELLFMLDRDKLDALRQRAGSGDMMEVLFPEEDIKPLAERCIVWGAKVVLVKCGAAGIYYMSGNQDVLSQISSRIGLDTAVWADREGFEASYIPERVLSGTGAGDTSIAAFLTALLNGETMEDALHLAAAEGASCVEAYDALSGLKSLDELKSKIKNGWKKREVANYAG